MAENKRKQKTLYDWDKIYDEYRTGTYSDAELSRRHGCSRAAIQKRAKKEGWERDLSNEVATRLRSKMVAEDAGVSSRVAGRNAIDNDETADRAAETRFAVVKCHRADIAALKALEIELIRELAGDPKKTWVGQYKGEIVERDYALTAAERAQAANNLANVQHKRIQLERQAYNIDGKSDSSSDPVSALLDEVAKRAAPLVSDD